jgi:hypothetical protein
MGACSEVLYLKGLQMVELTKEEQKQVFKEVLDEWLDKQFATFGRYTLAGLVSVGIAGLIYLWVHTKGFGA